MPDEPLSPSCRAQLLHITGQVGKDLLLEKANGLKQTGTRCFLKLRVIRLELI